ncbi:hypothetical protein CRN81_00870 [Chromobacterium violaceum]|nr:hypothetical protein CRN81_00870 [Chromobacterium violaceum]
MRIPIPWLPSMHQRLCSTLAGWPALASLSLLLANDWWLKQHHPGWLSGKLSDFAGLALVGMLALAIWPKRFATVSAGIALAWLWWKSPQSTPAIDAVNHWLPFRVARVVDYSDLIALSALPLSRLAVVHRERLALAAPASRRWLAPPLAFTALLACAASATPYSEQYSVRTRIQAAHLDRAKTMEALNAVAAQYQLRCQQCDPAQDKGLYEGSTKPHLLLRYQYTSSQEIRFDIWAVLPGVFNGSERERLKAIRGSILREMALRIPKLDYLEAIN